MEVTIYLIHLCVLITFFLDRCTNLDLVDIVCFVSAQDLVEISLMNSDA